MSKTFASVAVIATLLSVVSFNAQALPGALSPLENGVPGVTLIAGGCGLGFHRGPYGGCRVNEGPAGPAVVVVPAPTAVPAVIVAPRACPLGFHLGPYGRRCFPN
jgi:hypothetical protein